MEIIHSANALFLFFDETIKEKYALLKNQMFHIDFTSCSIALVNVLCALITEELRVCRLDPVWKKVEV